MPTFWVTFSPSQVQRHWPGRQTPHGGGYVSIAAKDREAASTIAFDRFGTTWAFLYTDFNNIDEDDRYELGSVTEAGMSPPRPTSLAEGDVYHALRALAPAHLRNRITLEYPGYINIVLGPNLIVGFWDEDNYGGSIKTVNGDEAWDFGLEHQETTPTGLATLILHRIGWIPEPDGFVGTTAMDRALRYVQTHDPDLNGTNQ